MPTETVQSLLAAVPQAHVLCGAHASKGRLCLAVWPLYPAPPPHCTQTRQGVLAERHATVAVEPPLALQPVALAPSPDGAFVALVCEDKDDAQQRRVVLVDLASAAPAVWLPSTSATAHAALLPTDRSRPVHIAWHPAPPHTRSWLAVLASDGSLAVFDAAKAMLDQSAEPLCTTNPPPAAAADTLKTPLCFSFVRGGAEALVCYASGAADLRDTRPERLMSRRGGRGALVVAGKALLHAAVLRDAPLVAVAVVEGGAAEVWHCYDAPREPGRWTTEPPVARMELPGAAGSYAASASAFDPQHTVVLKHSRGAAVLRCPHDAEHAPVLLAQVSTDAPAVGAAHWSWPANGSAQSESACFVLTDKGRLHFAMCRRLDEKQQQKQQQQQEQQKEMVEQVVVVGTNQPRAAKLAVHSAPEKLSDDPKERTRQAVDHLRALTEDLEAVKAQHVNSILAREEAVEKIRAELEPVGRLVALGRARALVLNTRLEQLVARQRVLDKLVQRAARAAGAARAEALQDEDDALEVGLACAELQALVLQDAVDELRQQTGVGVEEEKEGGAGEDEQKKQEGAEDTPSQRTEQQWREAKRLREWAAAITVPQ